jgi:hypothetical protein
MYALFILFCDACSAGSSAPPPDGPSTRAVQLGKPIEMPSTFVDRSVSDLLVPGSISVDGAVWYVQNGDIFIANQYGTAAHILDTSVEGLLSFAAGGGAFAWLDDYGLVYFYDIDRPSRSRTYEQRSDGAWWSTVALSPSGLSFAIADELTVRLISGTKTLDLPRRPNAYYRELFVSDHFAFALNDRSVDAWTLAGQPLPRLTVGGMAGPGGARPSNGEEALIALCAEGSPVTDPLTLVDLSTGKALDKTALDFESSHYVNTFRECLATSVDESGKLVAAGSSAGEVALWDRTADQISRIQLAPDEAIDYLAIAPSAEFVYVGTKYEPEREPSGANYGRRYLIPIEVSSKG